MGSYVTPKEGPLDEKPQILTGKGWLESLYVVNLSTLERWVWVYDGPTPEAGRLMCGPFPLAAKTGVLKLTFKPDVDLSRLGRFDSGVCVASSSSGAAYAAAGTADFRITADASVR